MTISISKRDNMLTKISRLGRVFKPEEESKSEIYRLKVNTMAEVKKKTIKFENLTIKYPRLVVFPEYI